MPKFDVEFAFDMRCVTRGYTIEAKNAADAEAKAAACIDKYGTFDPEAFTAAGGDTAHGTWSPLRGEASCYEVADVRDHDTA